MVVRVHTEGGISPPWCASGHAEQLPRCRCRCYRAGPPQRDHSGCRREVSVAAARLPSAVSPWQHSSSTSSGGRGRGRGLVAIAASRGQRAAQEAAEANKYSEEVLEWLNAPDAAETSAKAGRSGRGLSWRRRPSAEQQQQQQPHLEAAKAMEDALHASGAAAVGRADGELRSEAVMMTLQPRRNQPGAPPMPVAAGIGYDALLLAAGVVLAQLVNPFRNSGKGRRKDPPDASAQYFPKGEPVEWVNMCLRKLWRVYQRGLERWITELLQPVFDWLIEDLSPAALRLRRLKILEFTLDHEAPTFSNMRRRNSRKDSDLSGVVDCRYTGGAKMLLQLEFGVGRLQSVKVPVMVSDLDLQGKLWIKLRLAPMCPWIGTICLGFVGPPRIQVQLSPYNRVPLMRVPIIQKLLAKLLIEDLPALMVLPERLEINIPASITTLAEAAVGRDAIMQAVASAVLQAESKETSLASALPLGKQGAAGGIVLPDMFVGEVAVLLRQGRNLPVWGTSISSNPWCRIVLGEQAVLSKRNRETSSISDHRNPVWNQDFQFLVQDPDTACLEFYVKDSHLTGRTSVGLAVLPLISLPDDRTVSMWIPVMETGPGGDRKTDGEILVEVCYKAFEDEEDDEVYGNFIEDTRGLPSPIVDIKSAADASSRANVAQSAAIAAVAVTKAAAARAATKAAQAAQVAGTTTAKATEVAGNTARAAASQLSKVNPLASRDRDNEQEGKEGKEGGGRADSDKTDKDTDASVSNGNGNGSNTPGHVGNGREPADASAGMRESSPQHTSVDGNGDKAVFSSNGNGNGNGRPRQPKGEEAELKAAAGKKQREKEKGEGGKEREVGAKEKALDQEAESRKMVEIALRKVYSELGDLEQEKKEKAANGALLPTGGRSLAFTLAALALGIGAISRILMCINGIVD